MVENLFNYEKENSLMNPQIDELQIINIISIAIGIISFMVLAILVFFYFSQKKIIKTKIEKANLEVAYQKELLQRTITTQEEERKRIAQELHDAISSKLNIVSLHANLLAEELDVATKNQKTAKDIVLVTGTVLESSRRIAHDLLPPSLDKFGLQPTLEGLCEELDETLVFKITHNIDTTAKVLSKTQELHVFRIFQELLNNSIKYAQAKSVIINVKVLSDSVKLQYKDDGVGFNNETIKEKRGLGLSGIENRIALLEGTVKLNSSLGNGMQLDVTIPINTD